MLFPILPGFSEKRGVSDLCSRCPESRRTAKPLASLLCARLRGAEEANSLFARTEDGCCSLPC